MALPQLLAFGEPAAQAIPGDRAVHTASKAAHTGDNTRGPHRRKGVPLQVGAARTAVEAALAVVEEREATVRAFVHLDAGRARREADLRDAAGTGSLLGLTLGVKDIFDTADAPTAYGSVIYAGFRPRADAAVVALLRDEGVVCLGKTVTAEFAMTHPGPTTNPHRETHTPGGSSSGSAAAVAAGMVDVALGTQTAGSVIRPASFCGVYGFKPTFGTVATAGVKPVAPSLDTVGWLARDPWTLDRVRTAVTGRRAARPLRSEPQLRVVRTDHYEHAEEDARAALDEAAARARAAGAQVAKAGRERVLRGLTDGQEQVMNFEAARSLAWEASTHWNLLSPEARARIEAGRAVAPEAFDKVRARAERARTSADELFAGADLLLALAAVGEAPYGLSSTGDPRFCRVWTLLGFPAVCVPGLLGATRMPIGVQVVGRPGDDAGVIAGAAWLGALLGAAHPGRAR